ncbi:MAG: hypothetical protein Q8P00_06990 [Dehalococcoidia bacterium]|nr:hypothetical protein [Dehalococcoidia bacterium]
MKKIYFLLPALGLAALLALASCVPGTGQSPYQQPYQYGPGGMGGGMMGGQGGMMGGGMMGQQGPYGPNSPYNPSARPLTIDQAADSVRLYLKAYGGRLELKEVMEFTGNFYAEIEEKDTGTHAMELLIDKYNGQVSPEMGPNMMWNTKYGMMAGMMGKQYGEPGAKMPVSAEQAAKAAQQYLNTNMAGLTLAEADAFYGYYTLHTLRDGKVEGMLSVNGYDGAIWYHSWHGSFTATKRFSAEGRS